MARYYSLEVHRKVDHVSIFSEDIFQSPPIIHVDMLKHDLTCNWFILREHKVYWYGKYSSRICIEFTRLN